MFHLFLQFVVRVTERKIKHVENDDHHAMKLNALDRLKRAAEALKHYYSDPDEVIRVAKPK